MASQNGASWLIEAIIFVIRLFAMSSSEDVEEIKETDNIAHPWPYLSSMFAFKSINGMKVKLSCLLCCPKGKECSASLSSLSNLRTHVKVSDKSNLLKFLLLSQLIYLQWIYFKIYLSITTVSSSESPSTSVVRV